MASVDFIGAYSHSWIHCVWKQGTPQGQAPIAENEDYEEILHEKGSSEPVLGNPYFYSQSEALRI